MEAFTIGGTSIGKILSDTSFQQKMTTICFIRNDEGELFVSEARLFTRLLLVYLNRDKSDPILCNQPVTIPFPKLHDQTVIIEKIAVRTIFYYTLFTARSNIFKHELTVTNCTPNRHKQKDFHCLFDAIGGDLTIQYDIAYDGYEESANLLEKEREGISIDVTIIEDEEQQKALFWYNRSAAGGNREAVVPLLLYFYNYGIVPENLPQLLSQLEELCEAFARDPENVDIRHYCPLGSFSNADDLPNEAFAKYFEALVRECYRKNNQVDKALEWEKRPRAQGRILTIKEELAELPSATQEASHTDKKVRLSDDEEKEIIEEKEKTALFHKQRTRNRLDSQD